MLDFEYVSSPPRRLHYTYEEYLALEEESSVRHEYLEGEIYAMAGGTPDHAALAAAVISLIGPQLPPGCRAFTSDLRVRIAATGLTTYPDAAVVCGRTHRAPDDPIAVVNPVLIVDVTSASTEDYDRGEKLRHYKTLASVREVLIVSHRQPRLELHARGEGGWTTRAAVPAEKTRPESCRAMIVQAAALGFSPHSGWAALVALGGDLRAPELLLRERIEMTRRGMPGPKQPYHEVEGMPVAKAARLLDRYLKTATDLATDGLRGAKEKLEAQGYSPRVAVILQSSGRQGTSLEAILASHALIHTADGDHFRDALTQAGRRCGLDTVRIRQKELAQQAAAALKRPAAELQAQMAALGKTVGPPWTADQKQAALLAWLALAAGR